MGKKGVTTSTVLMAAGVLMGIASMFMVWEKRPIGGKYSYELGLTFVNLLGGRRDFMPDWNLFRASNYCVKKGHVANEMACKLIDVRRVCGWIFMICEIVGILAFTVAGGLLARYISQTTPRRHHRQQALAVAVLGAGCFVTVSVLFTIIHYLAETKLDKEEVDGGILTHFRAGYWCGLGAAICSAAVPGLSGLWVSVAEESTELRREEQMYLEEVGGYTGYGGVEEGGVKRPMAPVKA